MAVLPAPRGVTGSRARPGRAPTTDPLRPHDDAPGPYSGILDAVLQQAIIATDDEGRITVFSPGAARLVGRDEADLLGRSPTLLHDSAELAERAADLGVPSGFEALVAAARDDLVEPREWTWRTRSGAPLTVSLTVTAVREHGSVVGFTFIALDMTDRRRAEQALRDSEERFRLGFENAIVGMKMVCLHDGEFGRVLRVNPALCSFLGCTEVDLGRRTVFDIVHPEEHEAVADQMRQLLAGDVRSIRVERRYLHADGRVLWGLVSASFIRPETAEPYLLDMVEDITSRKEAEAVLTHQALHDQLTGLPNRAMLSDHLEQALARSRRSGTVVGVLFIDLDDFKKINDSFGHDAGDECLIEVARHIRAALRGTDTAARLGGDEFVVVCEDLHRPEDVRLVVQRLQLAVHRDIPLRGERVRLSCSIGVTLGGSTSTPSSLLRDADAAMYTAKERGKGRAELADSRLRRRVSQQRALESELRTAVDAQQLVLHFQPVLDLGRGELVAAEALLRWDHPARGMLAPAAFLEVVEASDLNERIGSWVLHTAADAAAGWLRDHPGTAPEIWVNINSRQLGTHRLVRVVDAALKTSGLPADRLCVELTERQALGAAPDVRADLAAVRRLGVQLAIDDFGTGHNGLGYLREIPVDAIKIDKSYVDGLGVDRTDTALISSIFTLGANLDVEVVAEGVETAAQRDNLLAVGCRLAQGYLLGRPVPAEGIRARLTA